MMDPPPAQRDVVANELRHHLLEWDGGGSTTVLCLHGFLDLSWGFASVAPAFARAGYHVVAPDFRGHGDSDRVGPGGYYYFMDYVHDVADLVEQLARERLAIVGHSMGGSVAALYAGAFPDRAAKVVAMESIHVLEAKDEDLPRRAVEWILGVRRARQRGARALPSVEACADRIRRFDPRCPPDVALFLAERGTLPVPGGRAFKHDPVHVTRGPAPYRLAQAKAFWRAIRCPVLLLEAEESEMPPPPDMEERVACFHRARRRCIAGAGHMMMRHQPDRVARAVLDFLAEP
ncbi:MAG TPA: alpha/beta hydrolase [Anaeromyxobacteraceae bacterium]|nr:alpha/beta hydrolase [Anaeromyxobacteraceae bacterium]